MKGGSAQQKQGPPPHPGGSWPFGSAEGPVLRLRDLVTEDQSVFAEKRHPLSPRHAPRCGHSAGPMHVLLAICNRSRELEAGVGQQPRQSWQGMGLHPGLVRRPEGQLYTLPPHPDGQEAGTPQLPGAKKLLAPACSCADSENTVSLLPAKMGPFCRLLFQRLPVVEKRWVGDFSSLEWQFCKMS